MNDEQPGLFQFTVIVKPFRAEAVLRAAAILGVVDCSVREAKGYSRQKGYLERYIGSEYSQAFIPKVEITIWVASEKAAEVSAAIMQAARTGRIGDGKIFVVPTVGPGVLEF
ncbi:P-II family nitrogen regulator [Zavarzinella formosa]|uniref:P-II family nitrogen regulator n=1 Tax=Zavarzinella formosa TaxID=360055 RepID=UPI0002F0FA13|nr:P-II family nitrogen regulator [Zavarzinella formosa]